MRREEQMECQIKNCKNNALLAYAGRWICGDCFMQLYQKEMDKKNAMIEEFENDA